MIGSVYTHGLLMKGSVYTHGLLLNGSVYTHGLFEWLALQSARECNPHRSAEQVSAKGR